ncbi:MAG TPA: helix-turn-helix transcriptional regulator [Coriobacteriia bacterium]|nr:helix-turn-helix transcriptional regulator [Coriobacteriia bacterium]
MMAVRRQSPESGHRLENSSSAKDPLDNRRDSKALDYLTVIIGFGLCRAWIVLCLATPFSAGGTPMINRLYLVVGLVSALVVAVATKRLGIDLDVLRRHLYLLTGILLAASIIAMPPAVFWSIEPLVLLSVILGGCGAGFLQVLWGEQFAGHETRFAASVAPAAAILTAVLVALTASGVSAAGALVGYLFFPLLSFSMLVYKAQRSAMGFTRPTSPAKPDVASGITAPEVEDGASRNTGREDDISKPLGMQLVKLMVSIMVFSALCRLFDVLPHNHVDPFGFFGGSALFSLVIVGGTFLIFALVLKKRFDPVFTYRMSLPVMVAGFVAIALFFDVQAPLCILLINIGYEFFDILAWILFTEIARRRALHAFRVFGFGVTFMFAGMVSGSLIGSILNALITTGELQVTVIALFCTLSLVVVAFLVMPEGTLQQLISAVRSDKRDSEARPEAPDIQGEPGGGCFVVGDQGAGVAERISVDRLEANCAAVAEAYGLTPREREVLVLLAHGRTVTIIARDLMIASGTARTHAEKIYRKINVHKQQELIDLVDGFATGAG